MVSTLHGPNTDCRQRRHGLDLTLENHECCEKASLIIAAGSYRDRSLEGSVTPPVVARLRTSWHSTVKPLVNAPGLLLLLLIHTFSVLSLQLKKLR
ncbi:unnamed protein product [Ascophyllum nodosum]